MVNNRLNPAPAIIAAPRSSDHQPLISNQSAWLGTEAFADLARISARAARQALQRGAKGAAWRGHRLVVRRQYGPGGRAGLAYQVAIESLPADLRSADSGRVQDPVEESAPAFGRRTARNQGTEIAARWDVIGDAIEQPRGSAQRATAIHAAASRNSLSERTLYRWIDQYEAHGLRGLARAQAARASAPRVIVSRRFDGAARAAGYPEEVLRVIATDVQAALKGLWASRAEQAGCNEVRRLAEFLLLEACAARGVTVDRGAARLSRRGVERFAHYRVVNQRRNDRKTFDDAKPRIRRDWTGLLPLERVVADVKHLDVIVRRPDGSRAWPKIVGFMDAGTGRIFVHPVLLDPGEGVRQEHVIEGFLAMVSDPAWGFPQGLYLDNGSEMAALLKIEAALSAINEPGARTIIFARPYNASAKPIESLFARLDRYVFAMLPGYAGSDRTAKKTQTVGKAPEPYPGAWEEFCATVQGLVGAYHHQPVGGQWAGRSPNNWFEEKVATGWRPSSVDPLSLDAAFCNHDSRRLDRGVVKVKGERFSHAKIACLPSRTVIDLALPWRREASPLARVPGGGWVRLTKEIPYSATWIAGARESSSRQQAQTRYVTTLAKEAMKIDPIATKLRWSRAQASRPSLPASSKLDLGEQLNDLGARGREGETVNASPSRADSRRAREMALTERLEREQRRAD
jgi:hypothetical protein